MTTISTEVIEAIAKAGQDIRSARRRRRISVDTLAQQANISRTTLYRVEMGDPNVAISTYAAVLFILGKAVIKRLADVADPSYDSWRELDEKHLPKRVRLRRRVLKD